MPTKRFKYIIDNNGTQTELTTDPKGWESHEIAFDRNDDFGLNIQNAVSLSFSGVARNILKSVYESNGIFKNTKTIIKRRKNDWTYAPFYVYRHDYSKYKDNMKYVEIPGIEDGLADKFDTYKDTEYEIDLPISNKIFIDYSGAKYTTTNQIQAKYGELEEKEDIGEDYYVIGGSRAVRAYNNKIAFTDSEGLPYETMTFRALKTASIDLEISLKITIEADAALGQVTPSSGVIKIVKHNAAFESATTVITYTVSSSTTTSNNRIDTFNSTHSETISIESGYLYSLFYEADDKAYDKVSVTDGAKCYIDISNEVDSAYQNAKLEAFSYEWLIEQLLLKIDPSAEFESTVAYPNIKELISCTPCVQNMGKIYGAGKIKTTLKDVLESFNKLKCIAIDITGNKMTIKNRSDLYPKTTDDKYGVIAVNNIVVEHDISHQYNKIKVGANTDDRRDDDPLVYPFICEKQYNIENTLSENELDLVNNFMLDPYAIDKYIIDTLSKEDVKDECKFMVFAVLITELVTEREISGSGSSGTTNLGYKFWTGYFNTSVPSVDYPVPVTTVEEASFDYQAGRLMAYTQNDTANVTLKIKIRFANTGAIVAKRSSIKIDGVDMDLTGATVNVETTTNSSYLRNVEIETTLYVLDKIEVFFETSVGIVEPEVLLNLNMQEFYIKVSDYSAPKGYEIYKDHAIISGFKGDAATIYNIPLTPQRILNRWKEYLAISFVGSLDKTLKFGTTEILNSAIVSKCNYEASNVSENTDFSLTSINPVFLPSIISVDTPETIIDVNTFEDEDKYKYFEFIHQKSSKTYQGWINSATFAISKNKSKQIMFQAKAI